jgi:hypothetical protein
MTRHLVISRFDEDIDWIHKFQNIDHTFIYNKGDRLNIDHDNTTCINTNNVGRESLTIFQHIYDNYENLPDVIIFFQGQINDQKDHPVLPLNCYTDCVNDEVIGVIRKKDKNDTWLGNKTNISKMTLHAWQRKLGVDNGSKYYIRCNNFAIGKNIIYNFPKEYYKNMINNGLLHTINPFAGHFVEVSNIDIFIGKHDIKFIHHPNFTTKTKDMQYTMGVKIKTS